MHIANVPNATLAPRHPAARKLPRRRQDQEPHTGQSIRLAQRTDRDCSAPCCVATSWPRSASNGFEIRRSLPHGHVAGGLDHRPAHRPRRSAAPPRAPAPARSGAGSHRRQAARPGGETGDRAHARHRHRQPLAGRDAGPRQRHRARDLHHPRLARQRAGVHRKPASPAVISGTARWCSTTSPPPTSKDAAVRWPATATAATAAATGRNW